ncbi:MAG: NAD-binding protein, partial [Verrucomicrobia bacterium]|nr:NAD-binding protein [Verrucomicrobiota bacterium]
MNVVILGAGKIGSHVASVLAEEAHNVILIDKDDKALVQVGRESDVARVHSEASAHLLLELLEQKPDLFFAATGSDET